VLDLNPVTARPQEPVAGVWCPSVRRVKWIWIWRSGLTRHVQMGKRTHITAVGMKSIKNQFGFATIVNARELRLVIDGCGEFKNFSRFEFEFNGRCSGYLYWTPVAIHCCCHRLNQLAFDND